MTENIDAILAQLDEDFDPGEDMPFDEFVEKLNAEYENVL